MTSLFASLMKAVSWMPSMGLLAHMGALGLTGIFRLRTTMSVDWHETDLRGVWGSVMPEGSPSRCTTGPRFDRLLPGYLVLLEIFLSRIVLNGKAYKIGANVSKDSKSA